MLRKYKRIVAAFLLLNFLSSVVTPTISWALTAGPTAPEATSFEPVDTTDMVNLITGDFVYNVPLLEVPGPSGGYPLSLSYHAGIQANEEASWCGLGFNLNPGAINRSVSGYVDDFQNITGSERTFWEGGSTETITIGINIGLAGGAGISAGLQYSQDTYKGYGVGHYIGVGLSSQVGLFSESLSYTKGVSPYGQSYSSTGISVGIGAATSKGITGSLKGGISFDQDGNASGRLSASVSYKGKNSKTKFSAIDASLSTASSGSFSVGGFEKSVHNSKSANVSTSGYNYSVDIPLPFGSITLGKSYQRYWIDETVNVATSGALYFPSSVTASMLLDNKAFDVYDLNLVNPQNTPDENQQGAFIDYDNYQVLGQGVSGSMRPHHYKAYLLRQTKSQGSQVRVRSYPLMGNKKPQFRFVGDFSNRFLHNMNLDIFNVDTGNPTSPLSFTFDPNQTTGSGENGDLGFVADKNLLPGSKSVDWFTNAQIVDKGSYDIEGTFIPPSTDAAILNSFIDCKAAGFSRAADEKIGGFKITNSSGVTYHYALPVYSYDEYTYSGRVDEEDKHHFNLYTKKSRYAYTWLLTAVTGPDFVDKNLNGYADGSDFGYWVTFEYGKWTSEYNWRNPSDGFNKDIDQNFDNYSKGKKEIYYLNTVTTRTHTAIFVKEVRLDGKSIVPEFEEAIRTGSGHTVDDIDHGGFAAKSKQHSSGTVYTDYPVSTLKLNSIYLVENRDFIYQNPLESAANVYYHSNNQLGKKVLGNNVIDIHDIHVEPILTNLTNHALRKIEFITDYTLSPDTPNSFKSVVDVHNTSESPSDVKSGRLTLKAIRFMGRNNLSLIPDLKFGYDIDEIFGGSLDRRGRVRIPNTNLVEMGIYIKMNDLVNREFKLGEIIRYDDDGVSNFGYITEISHETNEIALFPITDWSAVEDNVNATFSRTKNPPFNGDFYDLWGLYKVDSQPNYADFRSSMIEKISENLKRMTTTVSAQSTDVWSLRSITTSLGAKIKIEYEPDQYRSALKSLSNMPIKNIEEQPDGKIKITLYENLDEYGLENGDPIEFRFLSAVKYSVRNPGTVTGYRFECNGGKTYVYKWLKDDNVGAPLNIESVSERSFVLDYRLKDRFTTANCINEVYPYTFGDASSSTCVDIGDFLDVSDAIFLGGEIFSKKPFAPYGGDLRVKKITIEQGDGARSTLYEYFNGVTTYEPLGFAIPVKKLTGNDIYSCLNDLQNLEFDKYRNAYLSDVYSQFAFLFSNAREIPGPGVFYELVRVKEQVERGDDITELQGWSEYQFEVFSPESIDVTDASSGPLAFQFNNPFTQGSPSTPQNYDGTIFGLQVKGIRAGNYMALEDFSAILGSLKRITLYDSQGRKVTETQNQYLHDNFDKATFKSELTARFKDQGTIAETYADARIIINPDSEDEYSLYGLRSQKVKYPSIQIGQTTINYKTGITTTTRNLAFDFYSGEVTKTLTSDGYGNFFVDEKVPAYHKYNSMSPTAYGGLNMLTQEAITQSYKTDILGVSKVSLVGASVQTWSDQLPVLSVDAQPGIWRKSASFSFVGDDDTPTTGDGLYPLSGTLPSFTAWNWEVGDNVPEGWQHNGTISLYDVHSHALEASDVNYNYAATKMSADQTQVYASAANARYREFAYSGAEDANPSGMFGGDVAQGDGAVESIRSHTGKKSLRLEQGDQGFEFVASTATSLPYPGASSTAKKSFHASVWVHEEHAAQAQLYYEILPDGLIGDPEPNYTSFVPSDSKKAGDWYLFEIDIPLPETAAPESYVIRTGIRNNGASEIFVDDFRVHPLDAAMTSYVYNEWGELSHILDNNNLYTEYRYDAMGRLKETFRETLMKESGTQYGSNGIVRTGEVKYHYKGQN